MKRKENPNLSSMTPASPIDPSQSFKDGDEWMEAEYVRLRTRISELEDALRATAEFIRSRPGLSGRVLLLDHVDDVLGNRPREEDHA